ncbi:MULTISPECIES: hypothetical protein [unclassified Alteromonas]|uniref:hypothetical protein n=1 Tax=unclassified Alteromonas TaxID=2614992 RepID=UPI0005096F3A|nr:MULTISPECIES: hypothetical protein [unclassified Alteromonas]
MKFKNTLLAASLTLATLSFQSNADVIISGFGGDAGYGNERSYAESAEQYELPFDINISGKNFSSFKALTNGSIDLYEEALPDVGQSLAVLTPFRTDSNNQCVTCGATYIGGLSEDVVAVTWLDISQDEGSTSHNTFQALIIDRSEDTGQAGDVDIEFRYEELSYREEGTFPSIAGVSLPVDEREGLPGGGNVQLIDSETPQISIGDPISIPESANLIALPGSGTADILDLVNASNVGENGIWSYSVRDGEVSLAGSQSGSDGTGTQADPFMPSGDVDGSWEFEFTISSDDDIVFIDPDVAIGYDYAVESGPEIASVILPTGFDAEYELWLMGASGWEFIESLTADEEYFFDTSVTEFRVLGIDTSNMIDPEDAMAFVTGLSFTGAGDVVMTQTPITEFVAPTSVSEPRMIFLMLTALGLFTIRSRRKNK